MYIIPSLNAVVGRQTLLKSDAFADHAFLTLLLQDLISSTAPIRGPSPEVSIFPNPTTGDIWISSPHLKTPFEVRISTLDGCMIYQSPTAGKVDVSNLARGLYHLTLVSKDLVTTVPFVKQ